MLKKIQLIIAIIAIASTSLFASDIKTLPCNSYCRDSDGTTMWTTHRWNNSIKEWECQRHNALDVEHTLIELLIQLDSGMLATKERYIAKKEQLKKDNSESAKSLLQKIEAILPVIDKCLITEGAERQKYYNSYTSQRDYIRKIERKEEEELEKQKK